MLMYSGYVMSCILSMCRVEFRRSGGFRVRYFNASVGLRIVIPSFFNMQFGLVFRLLSIYVLFCEPNV